MKRTVRIALLGLAAAIAGLLFAASGRISVAASAGHSAPVAWFLHFTMRRAVRTQAAGMRVPTLDAPALLPPAAVHFERHCANCHGRPGQAAAPNLTGSTPPPPDLGVKLGAWHARELFWIVRHGIKYTGMPVWPALAREDEIWGMVAFLRRLPELTPQQYEQLASGAESAAALQPSPASAASCGACHGSAGDGTATVPRLAGQSRTYLLESLQAYAAGARASGFMQAAAAALDDAAMRDLATLYSQQSPQPLADANAHCVSVESPAAQQGSPQLAQPCTSQQQRRLPNARARGLSVVQSGIAERGIPACRHCHGADTDGRHPAFPLLQGQPAVYLAQQLLLFRDGQRGGGAYADLMRFIAERLGDEQIADVAAHYASQAPQRNLEQTLDASTTTPAIAASP